MPFFERERNFARKRAKDALFLIREKNGVQTFQSRQVIPCGIMERNGRKRCVLSEGNLRLMRRVAIDVLGKIKGMDAFAYHEVVVC